jgi:DNA-binding LytR/AlgR family response regulator
MDNTLKINCLIADDEPLARLVLEQYIALLPHLHLVKSCQNALEVLAILGTQKIDILFLDIKMPELTGLQLMKTMETKPKVILTTAYSEFALDAFDLGVTDYLMKPIAFDRFLKAVNRATEDNSLNQSTHATPPINTPEKPADFIFLKADKTFHKVMLEDIIRIEAYGNFIKVFTTNQTLLVADKISNIEQQIENQGFMRVHKSHIIGISHIKSVSGNTINTNQGDVPIGENYRPVFFQWLNNFKEKTL